MDIVVKGRNVEVPDHYREHVSQKLAPSERLDSRLIRIDVELAHEKNPRQSDRCQRVEITCYSKGPVIRAEACAADFYAALDAAVLKLEARLRKAHDRRRVHHGRHTPASVAEATAGLPVGVSVSSNGQAAESATETVAVLDAPQAPPADEPLVPTATPTGSPAVASATDAGVCRPWWTRRRSWALRRRASSLRTAASRAA